MENNKEVKAQYTIQDDECSLKNEKKSNLIWCLNYFDNKSKILNLYLEHKFFKENHLQVTHQRNNTQADKRKLLLDKPMTWLKMTIK